MTAKTPRIAGERIVYVRDFATDDLPPELRDHIDSARVYSIHAPDGNMLALAPNREQAFVVARQNDMTPVSVH